MKAMLLAAGHGSRLKPLTDTIPKPLLIVGAYSLIEYNLFALAHAGVREIVINVCHHADQIIDKLGSGQRYGVQIEYSREEGCILGTGGGILHALPLLGNEPFLLVSADVWSGYSFGPTITQATDTAHLVFVANPSYHLQGDYAVLNDARVSLHGERMMTYAGIAKIHPRLFANCALDSFSLSTLLNQAIDQGQVSGEIYRGPWFNVGTMAELARLRTFLNQPSQQKVG